MRSLLAVLFAALAILATAGPATRAENDTGLVRDPTLQRGGRFTLPFFGRGEPQARPRVAPVTRRPAGTVVVRDEAVIPKVDPSHFILVLGDSLADLLGSGLNDSFNDRPDVLVTRKARADTGLVRADVYDWPKAAAEILAGEEKVTLGVVLLGANDRQSIREGDAVHEPLSDRWREIYRDRIDAVAAAFEARKVPLVWVGTPPMQNGRLSADLVMLNELYRERVERAGGMYVDLWGGFVDAENRYTVMGPDITGQTARLRTADGVHFTKAGARKAAHFVDVAIRRLLESAPAPNIVALPSLPSGAPSDPELRPGGIERLIDDMVRGVLPEPGLIVPLPAPKPLAGPILPLTEPALAKDGALIAALPAPRAPSEAAIQIERVFLEGLAPEPRIGRADDFRWPRAN